MFKLFNIIFKSIFLKSYPFLIDNSFFPNNHFYLFFSSMNLFYDVKHLSIFLIFTHKFFAGNALTRLFYIFKIRNDKSKYRWR